MPASLDREPFSEEFQNHGQKEIGFWSFESLPVHDVMKQLIVSRSRPIAKFQTAIAKPHETLESHQSHLLNEQNGMLGLQHLMGSEKKSDISVSPWRSTNYNLGFSNLNKLSTTPNACRGVLQENSLFSNSVPETFNQKVILPTRDVFFPRQSQETSFNFNGEEPFETLEEIEARTIGNLLPHEDDLFTGIDEFGSFPRSNNLDDADDEIFRMELDDGLGSNRGSKCNNIICSGPCMVEPNGTCSGEHSHRELPSRTLFVRNINSSVEDDELKLIFEKYGDIRMLYTACKHRGFVMVSYYDIRSASNALKQLQDKPLRRRKLDIHYSIPKDNSSENDTNQGMVAISNLDPSVSNDDIHRIFSVCGEIKEISESPEKNHQKVVEFYDSRAAEAAFHILDGKIIAGKQIKLEPTSPRFTMQCALMQQFPYDPEQEEVSVWQQGSPPNGLGLGRARAQTLTVNGVNNIAMLNQLKDSRETLGLPANRVSPSFPHFLPPRSPYVGDHENQPGVASIEGSLGKMNLGFQRSPNFHSHSLPEHPNGLSPDIFRNSLGIMSPMDANIARLPKGAESRHVNNGGLSYNHALGAPGNGVCLVHGHQYARNRYPPYHPPHSGNMLWQNSPPFMNNIVARSPSQLHGFSRTPPHMLNNPVPFHHHVGSAPATNAPLWERHHGYTGDLMEGSPLHPASLGSMGFSASPTMHPMEFASRNIFPFAEGNCMDPPLSAPLIGIPSPQQSCQMFGGQNPMIHFNARYSAAGERMRSRRTDSSTTQGDNRKQYELDIERIMRGEDNRTTLMIKNIPNKYTSKMLLATIDEHHRGTYDFIYLPIDFKNKCNVGYAFINLVDPKHIVPFYETFNGKKWEKFNSEKVASLAYARIQGKAALVAHFQNSSLMNEDKRCRPILFHSDGPNAGDQEPFPMGASTRSRPGRPRSQNSDDDHQQRSPPSTSGGEDTANGSDLSPASKKSSES